MVGGVWLRAGWRRVFMEAARRSLYRGRWARRALGVGILGVVGAVLLGLSSFLASPVEEEVPGTPGVLLLQDGNLLYTYHIVSRTEGLFDVTLDPECLRNLARERPGETARLRSMLVAEMGVASLAELGAVYEPLAARLRGLGYL